jgi:hypothetical protein
MSRAWLGDQSIRHTLNFKTTTLMDADSLDRLVQEGSPEVVLLFLDQKVRLHATGFNLFTTGPRLEHAAGAENET